ALHRVSLVFTHEDRVLRRLADQARFAAQIAVALGALAGHQDLRVHPDGKLARFDADHRAHAGHAVGPDGDDLARAHESAVDAVPFPVRRGMALARRRAPVAAQSPADEMVLGEKALEVFVGGADVAHVCSSAKIFSPRKTRRTRRKKVLSWDLLPSRLRVLRALRGEIL